MKLEHSQPDPESILCCLCFDQKTIQLNIPGTVPLNKVTQSLVAPWFLHAKSCISPMNTSILSDKCVLRMRLFFLDLTAGEHCRSNKSDTFASVFEGSHVYGLDDVFCKPCVFCKVIFEVYAGRRTASSINNNITKDQTHLIANSTKDQRHFITNSTKDQTNFYHLSSPTGCVHGVRKASNVFSDSLASPLKA